MFAIANLQARGLLAELRMKDLRFAIEESKTFF
jgi:ATP/maltotriose-dependent transcriptional regulator MalT